MSLCGRTGVVRLWGTYLGLLGVGFSVVPAGAQIAFRSRVDVAVGRTPAAFALAGADARQLIVANDKGISLVRGLGNRAPVAHRIAAVPFVKSLAVGDFTGSSHRDIACISGNDSSILILPGTPAGDFGGGVTVEVPAKPRRVGAGVVDQEGTIGLFVLHNDGVSVLLPLDKGSFRMTTVGVPLPADFQVADLDNNGLPDLLVSDPQEERLAICDGAGEASFRPPRFIPSIRKASRILVLDLNGDRLPDLLVLGEPGLAVHLQDSKGGFAAAKMVYEEVQLSNVAAADLDGDGRTDLAVTNRSRNVVTFLIAAGDGSFRFGDSYGVGNGAEAVLAADITGDSTLDLLVLNQLGDSVTVLRGLGRGEYNGSLSLPASAPDLSAIGTDDFNRDSRLDLAVTSAEGGSVSLFFGDGRGGFSRHPSLPIGRQPRALVSGSFDRDPFPDLAVANFGSDEVALLAGDGHGGFELPRLIPVGLGPTAIARGDFQGKGPIDLAVANSISDSVSILYGDGQGDFPKVTNFPVPPRPTFLLVGDLNNDRHADLVVGNDSSDTVAVLHGNGKELEEPRTERLGSSARPLVAEDFDEDGQMDLVVVNESADAIDILPGAKGGGFGERVTFPVGRDPRAAVAGDFDGDGRLDLAVVHSAARTVSILLNRSRRGDGSWREASLTTRATRH